jgi:hypothetical protein
MVPILRSAAWRKVRWDLVWRAAKWLYTRGRDRLEQNLSDRERQELFRVMRKSKGLARNLTAKERERFRELVRKALTGDGKGRSR